MSVSYLFIDAGAIAIPFKEVADRYVDGAQVAPDWARIIQANRKAFVYDAVPVQTQGEDDNSYSLRIAPKLQQLSAIERLRGFHVRAGDVRHRRRRGNEQKMVDIMLAVDALQMASRGLFGTLNLWTGDLDFKPLITALVDMGIDVHLTYPVNETSEELIAAADAEWPLSPRAILSWMDQASSSVLIPQVRDVSSLTQIALRGPLGAKWGARPYEMSQIYLEEGAFHLVSRRAENVFLDILAPSIQSLTNIAADMFDLQVPENVLTQHAV